MAIDTDNPLTLNKLSFDGAKFDRRPNDGPTEMYAMSHYTDADGTASSASRFFHAIDFAKGTTQEPAVAAILRESMTDAPTAVEGKDDAAIGDAFLGWLEGMIVEMTDLNIASKTDQPTYVVTGVKGGTSQ